MEPDSSLTILVQDDVLEKICQELTFVEAVKFQAANKHIQLKCNIRIIDPDNRVQFLPGVNPTTVQLYRSIQDQGSIQTFYDHVENCAVPILQILIESGVDPLKIEIGQVEQILEPLIYAAGKGCNFLINYLLDRGDNIDQIDEYTRSMTALSAAVAAGRESTIRLLLSRGASIAAAGVTSPILSYVGANADAPPDGTVIIKLLIEAGARVNDVDNLGNTPLMTAARFGHFINVKYLLDQGAIINTVSNFANSALSMAARFGYLDIVQLLVERGAPLNDQSAPLAQASDTGNVEIVRYLLAQGANINQQSGMSNSTALMHAVLGCDPEVVRVLLEGGADLTIRNNRNETALDLVPSHCSPEIAQLLREYL